MSMPNESSRQLGSAGLRNRSGSRVPRRILWLTALAAVLLPGCNNTHTATVEPQSIPAFHPGPLQHCTPMHPR